MFNSIKTFFFALGLITTIAWASDLTSVILQLESSGNYQTNTGNGAYGGYQQTKIALEDIGYINKDGTWNSSASGASSLSDYLSCSSCQTKGEVAFLQKQWSYMNSNGDVSKYLGTTGSNGITYNQSALLECANQMGAAGCNDYLANGSNCTNAMCKLALSQNSHFVADLATASEGDSSAITGGNTVVNNSALASGGSVSTATATAELASYCAKEVQALLSKTGEQAIDNRVTLASNSETGYTLMNGKGLLDDALANGGGIGNLTGTSGSSSSGSSSSDDDVTSLLGGTLSNAGYRTASCLDNILSGITSLGGLFSNFNLNSILSQLENMACSQVQSQFSNFVQPAYSFISNLNGDLQVGGGGWMPGMQIASVNLGSGNSQFFSDILKNNSDWYQSNSDLSNQLNFTYDLNSPVNLMQYNLLGSSLSNDSE